MTEGEGPRIAGRAFAEARRRFARVQPPNDDPMLHQESVARRRALVIEGQRAAETNHAAVVAYGERVRCRAAVPGAASAAATGSSSWVSASHR